MIETDFGNVKVGATLITGEKITKIESCGAKSCWVWFTKDDHVEAKLKRISTKVKVEGDNFDEVSF